MCECVCARAHEFVCARGDPPSSAPHPVLHRQAYHSLSKCCVCVSACECVCVSVHVCVCPPCTFFRGVSEVVQGTGTSSMDYQKLYLCRLTCLGCHMEGGTASLLGEGGGVTGGRGEGWGGREKGKGGRWGNGEKMDRRGGVVRESGERGGEGERESGSLCREAECYRDVYMHWEEGEGRRRVKYIHCQWRELMSLINLIPQNVCSVPNS